MHIYISSIFTHWWRQEIALIVPGNILAEAGVTDTPITQSLNKYLIFAWNNSIVCYEVFIIILNVFSLDSLLLIALKLLKVNLYIIY